MAQVTYNGIQLNYVLTKMFAQEPAFDPSGVDQIGIKFRIAVECVFNPYAFPVGQQPAGNPLNDQLPHDLSELRGTRPAVAMAGLTYPVTEDNIRARLLVPRKQFVFADDEGAAMLVSPPNVNPDLMVIKTDDRFGPTPIHANVVKYGTNTFFVEFAIECVQVECSSGTKQEVLSNRWKENMRIDRHGLQTRTHTGRLIIRGGSVNFLDPKNPPTADVYRGWVFPPIPAGFARESQEFTLAESGLELDYTIIDRQRPRIVDPDGPAMEIKATYTERTSNPSGATADAEISVEIEGHPYSDPRDLLTLAAQVVLSRLGVETDANGFPAPRGEQGLIGILNHAQVTEDLMFPRISLRVAVRKAFASPKTPAEPEARKGAAPVINTVGVPFGVDVSRIGISPFYRAPGGPAAAASTRPLVPGTGDSRTQAGASAGDFGIKGYPGILLLAQVIRSPCAVVNRPLAQKAVFSAAPERPPSNAPSNERMPPGRDLGLPYQLGGGRASAAASRTVHDVLTAGYDLVSATVANLTLVLVASLPPFGSSDGENYTVFARGDFGDLYTDYRIDSRYVWDGHTIQLPVASNADEVESFFARTAARTCRKVVEWTCERVGSAPMLPSEDTGDPNDVFMRKEITPGAPEAAPDAVNLVYRVSGKYFYGLKKSPKEGQPLKTGALPNLRGSDLKKTELPGKNYQTNILNPLAPPPRTNV